MVKPDKRKYPAEAVNEEPEDNDDDDDVDSSSSEDASISDSGARGKMLAQLEAMFAEYENDLVKKRKKGLKQLLNKVAKKKDDVVNRHAEKVTVTRPTELNGMLSDLNAKLAEKDTLVAQLWDDVAQIDRDAQDACKTYDEQIGKIVRDLEEVRKKSISAIDRIISEQRSLESVFDTIDVDRFEVGAARPLKKPRVTDVTLVGSD